MSNNHPESLLSSHEQDEIRRSKKQAQRAPATPADVRIARQKSATRLSEMSAILGSTMHSAAPTLQRRFSRCVAEYTRVFSTCACSMTDGERHSRARKSALAQLYRELICDFGRSDKQVSQLHAYARAQLNDAFNRTSA